MIASLSREKLLLCVYFPQKVYFYRYIFIITQKSPAFWPGIFVLCAAWDQARFSLFFAFFCWFSQVFITMLWGSSFTRRTCIRTGKPWME